jgi:hypothetical protein
MFVSGQSESVFEMGRIYRVGVSVRKRMNSEIGEITKVGKNPYSTHTIILS